MRAVPNRHYPLTPLQQGMVYQAMLGTEASARGYDVEQLLFDVPESVTLAALASALAKLLDRHMALRASFHVGDRQSLNSRAPMQSFASAVECPAEEVLITVETSGCEKNTNLVLSDFLTQDRQRGFDIACPPLMRCHLIKLFDANANTQTTKILWTIHHILLDGRSMVALVAELIAHLELAPSHKIIDQPATEDSYLRYLEWCHSQSRGAGLEHFRGLLAGKQSATTLPLAEPAGKPLDRQGYTEKVCNLSRSLSESVRMLADTTETTVATVLQGMWALVLARFTGDTDVVFGNTRSVRAAFEEDLTGVIGLFINTLPVRAHADHKTTVAQFLQSLRAQALAIRAFEQTALSDVLKGANAAPGAALFETLFMFEHQSLQQSLSDRQPAFWANHQFELFEQPALPLALTVYGGDQIELKLLFDRSRFTDTAIDTLLGGCQAVVEGLVCGAEQALESIDALPPAFERRVVNDWNATSRPFSDSIPIHSLFEHMAKSQPQAVALEVAGQQLTYQALESQANALANLLILRGVKSGEYVAVCCERGFDLVIALLAVVKAGAAYLPLDPSYPEDRLTVMIDDTQARLVITQQNFADLLNIDTLVLDGKDRDAWQQASTQSPALTIDAAQVCYTIFTSGSTGKPKGVVLSHRAVVNTLEWVNRTFDMTAADRLLFVTSPCFDLSVYDIFGMLGAGGTVVIATEKCLEDPQALADCVIDAKITVWNSAPAALQRLVPFFRNQETANLRICMLSGDWIPLTLPPAMWEKFPSVSMKSLGGATEAAIWSNWFDITEINPRWPSIPYGKPIQNARYHVLDDRLKPVPLGVAGDLYIGGTCLAEGYLNRPQLTAERFILDPLKGNGERLYKTGDLARYYADGNLEFLGRSDFQVKIRGYRVEMGEVESVIAQLSGVEVAVCVAFSDAAKQNTLIAYVVLKAGVNIDEPALKTFVAAKLPSFMIPSRVIFLPELPTTSNGKLDRNRLPAPGVLESAGYVAPTNDFERCLVDIWERVLGVQGVGIEDNFFDLGGTSLSLVDLMVEIKRSSQLDVSLGALLEYPTITSLVQSLKSNEQEKPSVVVPLNASRIGAPIFCISGINVYKEFATHIDCGHPVYGVYVQKEQELIRDSLGGQRYFLSGDELAEEYCNAITHYYPEGPCSLAGLSYGGALAVKVAHELIRRGRDVEVVFMFDAVLPSAVRFSLPKWFVYFTKIITSGRAAARVKDFITRRLAVKSKQKAGQVVQARAGDRLFSNVDIDCFEGGISKAFKVVLFKAKDSQNDRPYHHTESDYGWRKILGQRLSVEDVDGGHTSLIESPNISYVAEVASRYLKDIE